MESYKNTDKEADKFLHYLESNDVTGINTLLSRNISPNFAFGDGITALMFASLEGYYEIAKALIEHGADVNIACKENETALSAALAAACSPAKQEADEGTDASI